MHNCSIEKVRFYLDENEYHSAETYLLRGWIFGEEDKIQELRLMNSSRTEEIESKIRFPFMRPDVGKTYDEFQPQSSNSGFYIQFKAPAENEVVIEAKINDNWVLCQAVGIMPNRILLDEPISEVNLGNTPAVLAVDDFYTDPHAVRELALSQEFLPSEYHKGKRTVGKYIVEGTRQKIEQILGKRIYNWSSQPYNGVFQYCTPADPIVYHYDTQQYAAVVFLTPDAPPESGTSFYRSRKEQWLTKDPSEYNIWMDETHREVFREAMFGSEHDDFLDPSKWEEIDRIGNKFNRFAMWDAKLIHSATSYFGKAKENGRLFHMFFFDAY